MVPGGMEAIQHRNRPPVNPNRAKMKAPVDEPCSR
jgi:hypothetical protein